MSKIIFENSRYVVCLTRAGLSVQDKRSGKGKLLPPGPKTNDWIEAFETAIDKTEGNHLAKAWFTN